MAADCSGSLRMRPGSRGFVRQKQLTSHTQNQVTSERKGSPLKGYSSRSDAGDHLLTGLYIQPESGLGSSTHSN